MVHEMVYFRPGGATQLFRDIPPCLAAPRRSEIGGIFERVDLSRGYSVVVSDCLSANSNW
jgi:hypothetical protein